MWNLETNKTYLFRVKAENRYGISDPCTTEEVQITDPFGLPGPPEKPTIAEYSKTSMTLTWEPPRDNGGSMIIGYWLEKREKGTAYWAKVNKVPVTKRGMKGWDYQVSGWGFVSVLAQNQFFMLNINYCLSIHNSMCAALRNFSPGKRRICFQILLTSYIPK